MNKAESWIPEPRERHVHAHDDPARRDGAHHHRGRDWRPATWWPGSPP